MASQRTKEGLTAEISHEGVHLLRDDVLDKQRTP